MSREVAVADMNLQAGSILLLSALAVACLGCSEPSGSSSSGSAPLPPVLASSSGSVASAPTATTEAAAAGTSANPNGDSEPPPPLDLPADPSAIVEATFDHLKFDIEPDAEFDEAMLTPTIHKLFGRKIRIRGYIYPTLKKRGLKQFILVRDNQECCFGPGAALFDCILVHMTEGNTAEYSIRPVAVEGKFSFEIFPDPYGVTRAIYRLDGDSVE